MSEELALHQLMNPQEFLWGVRVEHENYAIKTSGGNLILLNVPNAAIGDVVSHTGGNNGVKGNLGSLYLTGVVVGHNSDGRSFVTISGLAPMSENMVADVGARVFATAGGQTVGTGTDVQSTFMGTVVGETEESHPIMALNAGAAIPQTPPIVRGLIKGSSERLVCATCVVHTDGESAEIVGHAHGVQNVSADGGVVSIKMHDSLNCTNGSAHIGVEGMGVFTSCNFVAADMLRVAVDIYSGGKVKLHVICFAEGGDM